MHPMKTWPSKIFTKESPTPLNSSTSTQRL